MTRGRQAVVAAAPATALLLVSYLLLEGGPALLGERRLVLLTRPRVLEPVRLVSLGLLEVVMPAMVLAGLLLLLRRTVGRAAVRLRAAGVLAGAVGSAEVLKWLLPAVQPGATGLVVPGNGSFPSGHTACAVALALLLTAVRPVPLGPVVAWGVAVATTTVTAHWHRPADALGGALLAVAWYRALFPSPARSLPEVPTPDVPTPDVLTPDVPRPERWLLGWWLLVAGPAVLAVAASWWSVPAPVHRVLPHVLATALLAAAVGAVIRWAAPRPAARSG